MPQRILSPGVGEFSLIYQWNNQVVENVYHVGKATPAEWTSGELADVCTLLYNWWHDHMRQFQVNTCILQRIEAVDLGSHSGAAYVYSSGLPMAGQKTVSSVPNNVTVTSTMNTAQRGRSYRGRNYFAGMGIDDVVDNIISAALQAGLQVAYQALLDAIAGEAAGVFLGVLSQFTAGAERTEGIATPIVSTRTDPVVDSQRRRLPGRGR